MCTKYLQPEDIVKRMPKYERHSRFTALFYCEHAGVEFVAQGLGIWVCSQCWSKDRLNWKAENF